MQYVISGLATGSIYALVALGLALIYRSTRILNFAHGDMATAGTFVAFTLLGMNLAPMISFPLAILSGCVLAMLFYFVILVPAQRRNATHLGQIILTCGTGPYPSGAHILPLGNGHKNPGLSPFRLEALEIPGAGNQ